MMATSTTMATETVCEQKEQRDVDMDFEVPVKTRKGKKNKESKGIPRQALQNLIASELESSAKETFESLMKDKNLNIGQEAEGDSMMIDTSNAVKDVRADETVEHKAACDGCGCYPIMGIRYKCSVLKDFDFCAVCEERLQHPHAFLKIRHPREVPSVMVTMLPAEAEQKKHQAPPRDHHGSRHGGPHGHRGPWGRGPGGCGGRGGHGGPKAWIMIMHKFAKAKGVDAAAFHGMSVRAGAEISQESLQAKFDHMERIANGEHAEYDWHKFRGQNSGGPMAWFKLFQQFVQEKNVTPEEIHEISREAGHEMSVETIREKLAKMPEWIKMGEAWKEKMAGGNCGGMKDMFEKMSGGKCGQGSMGGMMGECMKKFMASKCGEEMKAKCGGQGFNPADMMKNFMGANSQDKQTEQPEQKEQTEQTEEKKSEEPAQQKTFNPMEMMNKFLNSEGGADMKAKCAQNGFNPAEMMQKFMGGKADK